MDLREHVERQRREDVEREVSLVEERRARLRSTLLNLLGEEVVGALPNLREARYGDGPALDFDFGRLTFRIFRGYRYSGLTLLPLTPTGGIGQRFVLPETFLRVLGEYEEEAFGEYED